MIKNQNGQGLIEYLLIVALIGVTAMGIMGVIGNSLQKKFAAINNALGGHDEVTTTQVKVTEASLYKQRNMSDFMKDAVQKDKK